MGAKITIGTVLLTMLAFAPSGINAQKAPEPADTRTDPVPAASSKTSATIHTLTGCIQRGDAEARYRLQSEDGSIWDLSTGTLKIEPDVHHIVTVSGNVIQPFGKNAGGKDVTKDHGIFKVTKVNVVSTDCS